MSKVLLKTLRRLSPTMNQLVDKALQEGIKIITLEHCIRLSRKYWPNSPPNINKGLTMAAGHYPDVGLEKIIIINLSYIMMREGNLGSIEIAFAHEIGHILAGLKEREPVCRRDWSDGWPRSIYCAYGERKADRIGLELLKQVCGWNLKTHQLLLRNEKSTLFQFFNNHGYPSRSLSEMYYCEGLVVHHLSTCPKRKEIAILVKEITRLLK